MAIINASSVGSRGQSPKSAQGGSLARFFDKGLSFSVVLIIVVAGSWGVLWFLHFQINRQIEGYHSEVEASLASINQADAAAVEDFSARAELASEAVEMGTDPLDMLALLEANTIPAVALTDFYRNSETGSVTIAGITSDYRYIAEQMLRYRQQEEFANITVVSSARSEGGITFEFSVAAPEKESADQGIAQPTPTGI